MQMTDSYLGIYFQGFLYRIMLRGNAGVAILHSGHSHCRLPKPENYFYLEVIFMLIIHRVYLENKFKLIS